jgi:CheY-like chemotaxis protein
MKKILSVDDEPVMLRCLDRALGSRGYELIVTSDPEEGLKIFREREDIALISLDVRMPKINGFELFRKMREIRAVPVLFVTAYPRSFNPNDDDIAKMWKEEFADGTTDIIYKPFDVDTLFEKVEGLVGSARDLGHQ